MIDCPTIFDIGAHRGDTVAYYRSIFPDSTIYCFEPFPESFEVLKLRFQNDRKIIPSALAIADKTDRREFFVNHFEATNSLLKRPSIGRRYYHKAGTLKAITEVATISIDEFVNRHPLKNTAILKLDIQGGELAALKGASGMLRGQHAALIYIEVVFIPLYQDQPLFHDLCGILDDFGYTLFNLYDLQTADNGQLRYGDALFVSEQMRTEVIDKLPDM